MKIKKPLTNSQRGRGREAIVDHEDEHDVEIFDDDEVRLLAEGKRVDVNLNKKKGILKREISTTSRTARYQTAHEPTAGSRSCCQRGPRHVPTLLLVSEQPDN